MKDETRTAIGAPSSFVPRPSSLSLRTEAVAGVTTFFTMAYIVVVNPSILAAPGTGIPFSGAMTATVLVCFLMTLLMGLYADLPFAVAPGMGINAFFTYSIILGQGVPWPAALGIIFWAGVFFLLISVTPIRERIAKAIPDSLRIAAAVGIGIFLTFIGLKNAGIVAGDPVTFVKAGGLGAEALLALLGGALMVWLLQKRSPFAFLAGIGAVTAAGMALGKVQAPERLFSAPDFSSVFLKLDALGALKLSLAPAIIGILFTDLFDSLSTFVGVSHAVGMVDKDGNPKNLREGLIVDALATLGAGLAGSSSGTAYIESAAGIEVGGRTGLTSVFTALCFLPCFFLAPLAGMVPAFATAPVLVLVGALMFRSVAHLRLSRLEEAIPAFLTIILIPLSFSITQGILWGFVSYVGLHWLAGRRREVPMMLNALAAISIGLLVLEHGAWAKPAVSDETAVRKVGSLVGTDGNGARILSQDIASSIDMGNGSLWLYGDTFYGDRKDDGSPEFKGAVHNNSAWSTDRDASDGISGLRHLRDPAGNPAQALRPDQGLENHQLWPGQGIKIGSMIFLYYSLVERTGDGVWDFRHAGQGLASGADPSKPLVPMRRKGRYALWGPAQPRFGSAIVRGRDGWVYLYGRDENQGRGVPGFRLARVRPAAIEDPARYEYFAGASGEASWSRDLSRAASLFDDGPPEASVSRNDHLGEYLMLYSRMLEKDVVIRTATHPWGPWSAPKIVHRCLLSRLDAICYGGKEHPEFAREGGKKIYFTLVDSGAVFGGSPELWELTLGEG